MNRIVLIGDEYLKSPTGCGEMLESRLLLDDPEKVFSFSRFYGSGLTWTLVLEGAPLHVIGKNPTAIILSLGFSDLIQGGSPAQIFTEIQSVVSLLKDKTHASIFMTNLCAPLVQGQDPLHEQCLELNQNLLSLTSQGVELIDVSAPAEHFIKIHLGNKGESRSLRLEEGLTVLGKMLLSQLMFEKIKNHPGLDIH